MKRYLEKDVVVIYQIVVGTHKDTGGGHMGEYSLVLSVDLMLVNFGARA